MSKVTHDEEAFRHVYGRLTGDVGGILKLVDERAMHVPFWSLVRLAFPVAESIADLLYHSNGWGTARMLTTLLRNELASVRADYNRVAATLTVLYRHSLTHQDELRVIQSAGRQVAWQIDVNGKHLTTTKNTATSFTVVFNPKAFYEDLVAVLDAAAKKAAAGGFGGLVRDRYNAWLELDLDARAAANKITPAEKDAAAEIVAL